MGFNIWRGFQERAEAEFDDIRLVGISKRPNASTCAICARAAHGSNLTRVHQFPITLDVLPSRRLCNLREGKTTG